MKTYTIDVTQEEIKQGKPFKPRYCPLALAISKKFKWRRASVGANDFSLQTNNFWYEFLFGFDFSKYPLPNEAIKFRRAFDMGEKVEPFSFEIKI